MTGGSRGLGASISWRLARGGAQVVINCHESRSIAEALVDCMAAEGLRSEVRPADVADPDAVAQLFAAVKAEHRRLDVLANNAGINWDGPFLDMTLEQWDRVQSVNLRGAFLCSQHAARLMLRGDGGAIINIGATTGVRGRKNGANCCTAKAGLMVMTRCLALKPAPRIRVNTVVPGLVPTDETNQRFRLHDPAVLPTEERSAPRSGVWAPATTLRPR